VALEREGTSEECVGMPMLRSGYDGFSGRCLVCDKVGGGGEEG
jgi:hypothetical protein